MKKKLNNLNLNDKQFEIMFEIIKDILISTFAAIWIFSVIFDNYLNNIYLIIIFLVIIIIFFILYIIYISKKYNNLLNKFNIIIIFIIILIIELLFWKLLVDNFNSKYEEKININKTNHYSTIDSDKIDQIWKYICFKKENNKPLNVCTIKK